MRKRESVREQESVVESERGRERKIKRWRERERERKFYDCLYIEIIRMQRYDIVLLFLCYCIREA